MGLSEFIGNELNSSQQIVGIQTVIHSYPLNSSNLFMIFLKATNKIKPKAIIQPFRKQNVFKDQTI